MDKDPYTKVTFVPDFKRFGIEGLTDDIVSIMKKRVYDASGRMIVLKCI